MNGYTKLFQSIVTSSIWTEDDRTRIVWVTLLALADKHGEIQAAIPGLARLAGVSIEDCQKAIDRFMSPDPHSRTSDFEGRRLEKIDGGWALLNHAKYRRMASDIDRKEQATERKRRQRERDASRGVPPKQDESRNVTPCHAPPVTSHASVTDGHASVTPEHAKADTEAEAKADTKAQPLNPLTPLQGECAPPPHGNEEQANPTTTAPEEEKTHRGVKAAKLEAFRLRVGSMLRRRPDTAWSPKELKALKAVLELDTPEDDILALEKRYASNDQYLRRDVITLLNNWNGEIDKARNGTPSGPNHSGHGANGNPRNEGIAGFDGWHRDFQARAAGDGQHGPWDDFGRRPEVEGQDPEAGRVTPPVDCPSGAGR